MAALALFATLSLAAHPALDAPPGVAIGRQSHCGRIGRVDHQRLDERHAEAERAAMLVDDLKDFHIAAR